MTVESFFQSLWEDYVRIAPAAKRLHDQVEAEGETVINDHIAFRTYDVAPINLDSLERHVLALGYQRFAPYTFEDKKLRAVGYIHPAGHPRIFLSELETEKLSATVQRVARELAAQVDPRRVDDPGILWSGRLWQPVAYETYRALLRESEYAAWVAAIGLRANHFTVSINDLRKFDTLEKLLDFLESKGWKLNTSGGRIKGSPAVLLEQGSTMADKMQIEFAGGEKHRIPTCYYEFARRFPDSHGQLYQGFVAASADKIFESTNVQTAM